MLPSLIQSCQDYLSAGLFFYRFIFFRNWDRFCCTILVKGCSFPRVDKKRRELIGSTLVPSHNRPELHTPEICCCMSSLYRHVFIQGLALRLPGPLRSNPTHFRSPLDFHRSLLCCCTLSLYPNVPLQTITRE